MANFDDAYKKLDVLEGKYVNDPDDSGGETYKGIARTKNPKWKGWLIIDALKKASGFPKSLERNTDLQVLHKDFYWTNHWKPLKGDEIKNPDIAFSIFNFGVHAGSKTGIQLAQSAVKADADGIVGPATLKALNAVTPEYFKLAYTVARVDFYYTLCKRRPKDKKFLFGWIGRALTT